MRGSLSVVSRFFIDGTCVAALAPATNTMSGATFHPLVIMLLMGPLFKAYEIYQFVMFSPRGTKPWMMGFILL
jgi:hypothetical protein